MIKKSKDHLSSVNENYFEHMLVALKVSFKCSMEVYWY